MKYPHDGLKNKILLIFIVPLLTFSIIPETLAQSSNGMKEFLVTIASDSNKKRLTADGDGEINADGQFSGWEQPPANTEEVFKIIFLESQPDDFGQQNYKDNDLQDIEGKKVAIRSVANGKYLCAENGGGQEVVANRDAIGAWETFIITSSSWDVSERRNFHFQASNGQYLCAENGGGQEIVANRNAIGSWEKFYISSMPRSGSWEGADYKIELDICHSDIDNEGTKNKIHVEFWEDGDNSPQSNWSYTRAIDSNCWSSDESFTMRKGLFDYVKLVTSGSDALFIDEVRMYIDDELVKHHGSDDKKGWCLSTDPDDAHGAWKGKVDGGCNRFVIFRFN